MAKSFRDIREHLAALDQAGKLIKITRPINKDTELMPLVRWQFRGLPEADRKAFLFTNVVDVTRRQYNMSVVVGCLAASQEIYALGLNCAVDQIPAEMDGGREESDRVEDGRERSRSGSRSYRGAIMRSAKEQKKSKEILSRHQSGLYIKLALEQADSSE